MKKERGEDREIRRAREEEAWRSSRSGKLGVASSRCNFNIDMSDWLMPGCLERAGKIIERRRERLAEDADVAVEGDRRSYECNTSVAYTGGLQSNAKDRVKLGEILLNGRRRCRETRRRDRDDGCHDVPYCSCSSTAYVESTVEFAVHKEFKDNIRIAWHIDMSIFAVSSPRTKRRTRTGSLLRKVDV